MKLEERILIEIRLKEGKSISKISKEMNKSKTTISNEIKKYKSLKRNKKMFELHNVKC
ncbi:helix-turn-helix domain-containing protein [Sneathia sanguinegens]|uniref:helix-turn-helix domain-containing protein n=1 Tax=Sneathia sanguinegens TaxID=40543 RepID=UPI0023F92361|nr:helix-turn-helix domain-containing protein [Sneathia sanguinegens]